jgi:cysteine desulfurase
VPGKMISGMASAYIWAKAQRATETTRVSTAIYLDHAATTPMRPEAVVAMQAAAADWANPSSVHMAGRRARGLLERSRETVARHLKCDPQAIVFTSGGTEALAMVAREATAVSAVEHDAVRRVSRGAVLPVDADGVVGVGGVEGRVAVMHANNETGVVQPLADICAAVHATGGTVVCDAVQTAGKLDLPPADFIAVSAHKLGGPPGVGALIARCADGLERLGGQERGLRAGTENLPGIAAFAAALEAGADRGWLSDAGRWRDALDAHVLAACPEAEIFGAVAARLTLISCIRMPGVSASTQLMALDLAGFQVSSGAACSSGKVGPSHVLAAMGVPPTAAGETIRVSLGWTTTEAEVAAFAEAWVALWRRLGRAAA